MNRTIEKIVFEKTSTLLNSNIIVAKQSTKETMDCIKKTISQNHLIKYFLMMTLVTQLMKMIFSIMKIN